MLTSVLLGFLLIAAFLQLWAPFYPLTLLLGGIAACSRVSCPKRKAGTVLALTLLVQLVFRSLPGLYDPSEFMDPVVAPRLAQLWSGLELGWFEVLASLSLGAVLSAFTPSKWVARGILVASLFTVVALPATFTPDITRSFFSEPGNNQASDMRMSVKVFYLMERNGGAFYPAFYEAYCIRHKVESPAHDILGFNSPLMWWEWWALCKTVAGVFMLFQLHVVLALLALYWVGLEVTGEELCSALGVALWCCYSCHALVTPWWANIEHWILYWVPLVWFLYFKRQQGAAMGLMLLTMVARPQFGPLGLSPIVLALQRKDWRRAALWTATGLFALVLLAVHYRAVKGMMPASNDSGAHYRLSGGWWFLKNCMLFNWDFLPRAHLMVTLVTVLAVYAMWVGRKRPPVVFMTLQVLPVFVLLKVGYFPVFNYGMPFIPWLCLLAPAALALQNNSSDGDHSLPS